MSGPIPKPEPVFGNVDTARELERLRLLLREDPKAFPAAVDAIIARLSDPRTIALWQEIKRLASTASIR